MRGRRPLGSRAGRLPRSPEPAAVAASCLPSAWKGPRPSAGECDATSLVKWHQVAKKTWHGNWRDRSAPRPGWGRGGGWRGPPPPLLQKVTWPEGAGGLLPHCLPVPDAMLIGPKDLPYPPLPPHRLQRPPHGPSYWRAEDGDGFRSHGPSGKAPSGPLPTPFETDTLFTSQLQAQPSAPEPTPNLGTGIGLVPRCRGSS